MAGMKMIEDSTRVGTRDCIKFVERTTQTTYCRINRGNGCTSFVGMGTSMQSLSLGTGCTTPGITAHEFMHAAGYFL
jgi:meprin A